MPGVVVVVVVVVLVVVHHQIVVLVVLVVVLVVVAGVLPHTIRFKELWCKFKRRERRRGFVDDAQFETFASGTLKRHVFALGCTKNKGGRQENCWCWDCKRWFGNGGARLTTLDKQDMAEDKTFKLSPQHVLWNRVVAAVRGLVTELGEVRDMVMVTTFLLRFLAKGG